MSTAFGFLLSLLSSLCYFPFPSVSPQPNKDLFQAKERKRGQVDRDGLVHPSISPFFNTKTHCKIREENRIGLFLTFWIPIFLLSSLVFSGLLSSFQRLQYDSDRKEEEQKDDRRQ